jgi:thioredoxin-related protein
LLITSNLFFTPHMAAPTTTATTRPSVALPSPASLRAAGQAAAAKGEPLVVMTTLVGCPYCDLVRQHHLFPMNRAGEIVAIQLDIRDRRSVLQGFDGRTTSPAEAVEAWKARFAPTVLFFGPQGQELAERLVGMAVPDFYGEYLEARLADARRQFRK